MTWTHETPTRPGWYWYQSRISEKPICVRLTMERGNLVDDHGHRVTGDGYIGGCWAGPIPEPREPEKASEL